MSCINQIIYCAKWSFICVTMIKIRSKNFIVWTIFENGPKVICNQYRYWYFSTFFLKCNIWLDFYVSSIKNGSSANKTVQIQCIWINQRTLPSSIEWIWLNEICFKKHGKIFALVRWKDFYNKNIQPFNLFSTIHKDLFIEKNGKDSCSFKILFKSTHNFTIFQRITFWIN